MIHIAVTKNEFTKTVSSIQCSRYDNYMGDRTDYLYSGLLIGYETWPYNEDPPTYYIVLQTPGQIIDSEYGKGHTVYQKLQKDIAKLEKRRDSLQAVITKLRSKYSDILDVTLKEDNE